MSRLLAADFARLWKNRHFRACAGFMASFGACMVFLAYYTRCRTGYERPVESVCFSYANLMGIAAAAFVSLFWGTEYSEGTIRNKLVTGHERYKVYLSGLIVNAAGVLVINAVCAAVILGLGIPLLGMRGTYVLQFAVLQVLITVLMDLSFASLFTLNSMLNQNKASVTAVSIIAAVFLLFASGYIHSRLNEPEMYEPYTYTTDKGYVISREAEPNPGYLGEGTKRKVYELLDELLPSSQGLQIEAGGVTGENAGRMALYSGMVVLLSSGAGIAVFQRKDIK